jgi:hypothetical protein
MKKVERKNYTVRIHNNVDEERLKSETIKFVKGVMKHVSDKTIPTSK